MSSTEALASSTHSASDTEQLGRVYDMLTPDEALDPRPRYYLVGPVDDGAPVELPEEVYQVLRRVVVAMRQGLSVTISPTSQTLTTQQAADLLGISRPTLIKALDEGKMPFTRSGTHRRIALTDVLDYREKRREQQYEAIEALSVDVDETTDIEQALTELRQARKAVAAKRRSSQNG
ncbi:MAG TPA: helix-turn-helix domain-containing protein [Ruania sp.]|nr:helix-turn-helix domain-containing protein [Ruania sp.]